jgi:hypothetical protein
MSFFNEIQMLRREVEALLMHIQSIERRMNPNPDHIDPIILTHEIVHDLGIQPSIHKMNEDRLK